MKNNQLPSQIFLVGGGGHALSCVEVILSNRSFGLVGFTDSNNSAVLSKFGYSYLGNDSLFESLHEAGHSAAIGIGQITNSNKRVDVFHSLKQLGINLPVIVASTAYVAKDVKLHEGTIVFHNAVVNIGAQIGSNCIINTSAVIEHGCVVGSHTHLAPRSVILGDVKIGQHCFIGAGAIIFQGVTIPDYSVIPAGSFVERTTR